MEAGLLHSGSREADFEMPVAVSVKGTTFIAIYGVANGFVELMSADLGEGRRASDGPPPQLVAKDLLRTMATQEISRTEIPFMPDVERKTRKPAP